MCAANLIPRTNTIIIVQILKVNTQCTIVCTRRKLEMYEIFICQLIIPSERNKQCLRLLSLVQPMNSIENVVVGPVWNTCIRTIGMYTLFSINSFTLKLQ